jgi:virulence-associated protein VapD
MDNIHGLILKNDPNLLKDKNISFKSSLLRFAIENHCFKVADFMQTKYFVPPPINFKKDKVLNCDEGKEWIYKNDLFTLSDIFNYDLDVKLLDKWLNNRFLKIYQTINYLMKDVTFISEKHLLYLYDKLNSQVLNAVFIQNCSDKLLFKFMKKDYIVENPECICEDSKKSWDHYLTLFKDYDDDTKKKRFLQICEICCSNILDMFIDLIKVDNDILYSLMLRVNKDENKQLLNTVDDFIFKGIKQKVDINEFGSWFNRRRKKPIVNHDIYLLLKHKCPIKKHYKEIANSIYLFKYCKKNDIIISEKPILDFISNQTDEDKIKSGLKVAFSTGTKFGVNIQKSLEDKNINIDDIKKYLT